MDFSALSSAVITQINSALTGAVPVATLVLGVTVGYRIFKKFTKG